MQQILDTLANTTQTSIDNHAALTNHLEELLVGARPRLLHLARKRGLPPDAADDVAQETLLEAWRHLNHLRAPDRFDAWLNGICRNVCLRWQQAHREAALRQESFSGEHGELETLLAEELPDPSVPDPAEELSRQDLAILLDRALGHLPGSTRQALELYYLAELPQHEVAERLGLTINALEVRLHRARHQLRQVLNSELRADAEEFGLTLDKEAASGWRETRIWCMFCGLHHLQGLFLPLPDGRIDLHMRCPGCNREWIKTGGMHELQGLKSFRPAWNRSQQIAIQHWSSHNARQTCFYCKAPVQGQLIGPGVLLPWMSPWQGLRLLMVCPACDSYNSTYIGGLVWFHPLAQRFMTQHPRWINEPEIFVEYAGQPALRVRLTDIMSAARLTLLLHSETFQILTTFEE
jgi:RNA polymerase sigma-70 factor (ECF subfamily)